MSQVMEQLRTDHMHVARLLDIVERQLAELEHGARVDFDIIRDVMLYMTQYPDQIHHPTEDLVFERIKAKGLAPGTVIEDLEREHRGLTEKGTRFLDVIEHVVDGTMVARDEIRSLGEDYVSFLRYHMAKEDAEVFPLAESKLDPDDWKWVEARREQRDDPLFAQLAAHFQRLYEYIDGMRR